MREKERRERGSEREGKWERDRRERGKREIMFIHTCIYNVHVHVCTLNKFYDQYTLCIFM